MLAIRRNKRGFTLIELLVVIAIIAILAAILFPVFARAREAARKSSCQSNMKELGTALALYHSDYDAMLPSSLLVNPGASYSVWVEADYKYFGTRRGVLPPRPNVKQTWASLLYPQMKNHDIIWCPSDGGRNDQDANAIVSYWYKAAADRAWFGDGGSTWTCRKDGEFEYPADQIVFYEHSGWHWGDQSKAFNEGVTLNATFIDGHVKQIRLKKAAGNNKNDGAAAGEPCYYNYVNLDPQNPGNTAFTPTWVASPGTHLDPRYYSDNNP